MGTITIKDLISQLRRHPDHTPVYITSGDLKPLRDIKATYLHVHNECIFILGGELRADLNAAKSIQSIKPTKKSKPSRVTASLPTGKYLNCTTCAGSGEVDDNGPKACPSCGGNRVVEI